MKIIILSILSFLSISSFSGETTSFYMNEVLTCGVKEVKKSVIGNSPDIEVLMSNTYLGNNYRIHVMMENPRKGSSAHLGDVVSRGYFNEDYDIRFRTYDRNETVTMIFTSFKGFIIRNTETQTCENMIQVSEEEFEEELGWLRD